MDRQIFLQGMAKLSAVFHHAPSELETATYHEAVSSLSNESWVFAVNQCCRNSTRFPKPAELKEWSKSYRRQSPQVEHKPRHYTPAYNKARMAVCIDIMDGKLTKKQIAERLWGLIDDHPQYATELDREASEY